MIAPDAVEMSIGDVLSDLSTPCTLATKFEARIMLFNNINEIVTKGHSLILYSVCLKEVAVLTKMLAQLNKSNGEVIKKNPRILVKNNSAIVEFTTTRPVCIEAYENFKEYGRFIFRSGNATLGAGVVTKILA